MAQNKVNRTEQSINGKLRAVREELEQFQELKRILREDGIPTDEDDKRKESKLIQRILGFEKDLKRLQRGSPVNAVSPKKKGGKFAKAKQKQSRTTASKEGGWLENL